MITDSTVTCSLSVSCQNAYEKMHALILRIFSSFKKDNPCRDLKEEFYENYIDFARKLKWEGFNQECYCYMSICLMYHDLMDRPNELIAHEAFFTDLFDAFDDLLSVKISSPEKYSDKYDEFMLYCGKMEEYYYSNLALPSPYYDEEKLNEIAGCLCGDLK